MSSKPSSGIMLGNPADADDVGRPPVGGLKREEPDGLFVNPLLKLRHREVLVEANGITYQGILIGCDDEEIYLKTSTRHVSIFLERVTKVTRVGAKEGFDPNKHVDPAFYALADEPDETT